MYHVSLPAPFGSILVSRFSYRVAIFIGAVVAAVGLLASAFADSIFFLCISYGVVTGTVHSKSTIPKPFPPYLHVCMFLPQDLAFVWCTTCP